MAAGIRNDLRLARQASFVGRSETQNLTAGGAGIHAAVRVDGDVFRSRNIRGRTGRQKRRRLKAGQPLVRREIAGISSVRRRLPGQGLYRHGPESQIEGQRCEDSQRDSNFVTARHSTVICSGLSSGKIFSRIFACYFTVDAAQISIARKQPTGL